jgi:hypothetical protein
MVMGPLRFWIDAFPVNTRQMTLRVRIEYSQVFANAAGTASPQPIR